LIVVPMVALLGLYPSAAAATAPPQGTQSDASFARSY